MGRNTNTLSRIRLFLSRNDKGQSHLFINIAGSVCAHAGKEEGQSSGIKNVLNQQFLSATTLSQRETFL